MPDSNGYIASSMLGQIVKRLSRAESAIERIRVRERPTGDGGSGTVGVHPLPVSAGYHTGTLPWTDLSKTGASLADLPTRNYIDLQNREHNIIGADHTIAAAPWSLVGATSPAGALGVMLARSVASGPVTFETVLKTDSAGGLELVTLTAVTETITPQVRSTGTLTFVNAGSNDIRIDPARNLVLTYNRKFISDGANLIGYPGNGFGLWTDNVTGKAYLETDNITVRGRMNVYELVIRQIRSTNGNLLVSSSSKVKTATIIGSGPNYTIVVEDNTYHGFFPGDLIKAQRWQSSGDVTTGAKANIYLSEMTVLTTPTLTTYTAQLDNSSDPPQPGYDYVRHGNTSDVERQGMVYIAADETNSPYVAIINGVTSWADWSGGTKIKGLIGNINGSPIALPPDANGYEYGMVFGTGWTPDKQFVKISSREALFNKIDAKWYNGVVQTVSISPLGAMTMGKDISQPALTSFTFTATDGILKLGRSDTPAITFNGTTGASYFTGIMTLANTAEIRQGVASAGNVQTDAFSSLTSYTGFRLWSINAFSGQVGIMAGYNSGTAQWSASVNGRILVGSITNVGTTTATADVILSARGVTLKTVTGASDAADTLAGTSRGIRWYDDPVADTNPAASVLGGKISGGYPFLTLNVRTPTDVVGSVGIFQLSGSSVALWLDNVTDIVGFPALTATTNAGGGFDAAIAIGTNGTANSQSFAINDDVVTDVAAHWIPRTTDTYNLGSASKRWDTLYVRSIVADTSGGGPALSGQVWQYNDDNMRIESNAAANRILYIVNTDASGTHSLDVEGNITLGGTVDGVDVAALSTNYASHIADTNIHHNRSHSYDSTSDHTGTLSWANVNKTGSALSDLATRPHSALTGIGANDHHNQQHDLVGADHTASGLTSGHVLRATSTTAFGFGTITTSVISDFSTGARALFSVTDTGSIDMSYSSGTGVFSAVVLPAGVDHNALANLTTGDPHTQYVHISNARTITAVHTFNPGSATAPFILGANGQSQLVVGLRADQLNKSVIAGNGLTGGGILTADRTLTVVGNTLITVSASGVSVADAPTTYNMIVSGATVTPVWQTIDTLAGAGMTSTNGVLNVIAGAGITVLENSVGVRLATPSGLSLAGNELQLDDNIAGDGLVISGKILALGLPLQLSVFSIDDTDADTHSHSILTSSNPGAAESILATDSSGFLTLVKLTATDRVETPLITSASGPLTINAFDYVALQNGKVFQSQGAVSGFIGNGFRLDYDLTAIGAATLQIDNLYVRGTMNVYELVVQKIRATNGNIFVSASAKIATVSGAGPYVLTTDLDYGVFVVGDLLRAQRWENATSVMQSNLQVTAVGTGSEFTASLVSGDPPEVGFEYARLGNTTDANRQGGVYLSADDANSPFIDIWNGVTSHAVFNGGTAVKARFGRIDGATGFGALEYGIVFGETTVAGDNSDFLASTTGKFRIGKVATGKPNLTWDTASGLLALRSGLVEKITLDSSGNAYFSGVVNIGASGGIWQGTAGSFATPTNGLKIWSDSGIGRLATYNTGAVQVSLDATGRLVAGAGAVVLDASGITIIVGTAYDNREGVRFTNAGSQFVGGVWATDITTHIDYVSVANTTGTSWGSTTPSFKNSAQAHFGALRKEVAGAFAVAELIAGSSGVYVSDYFDDAGGTITLSPRAYAVGGGKVTLRGLVMVEQLGSAATPILSIGNNFTGPGFYAVSTSLLGVSVSSAEAGRFTTQGYGFISGTAALPGIFASSDANNGLYLAGTDSIGISTGGTASVTITGAAGNVVITGTLNSGAITSTGNVSGVAGSFSGAVTGASYTGGAISGTTGTFSGVISAATGSAGAPSHTFAGATTTGMFRATNELDFSVNGTERLSLTTSGAIVTGTFSSTSSGSFSSWNGNLTASGNISGVAGNFSGGVTVSAGGIDATGSSTITGTLGVTGTLTGASASFSGSIVAGSAILSSSYVSAIGTLSANSVSYRVDGTANTGLSMNSSGVLFAIGGGIHYLSREDGASDSYLRLGYNITTTARNAFVDFHTDPSTPTTRRARLIRWSGTNGTLDLENLGTGLIRFLTNGSLAAFIDTNNNLWLDDTISGGGTFLAADGTAVNPSFRFANDTNTGMWWQSSDLIGWSTGGTNRVSLSTTYFRTGVQMQIPDGGVSAPGIAFTSDTDTGFYRNASGVIRVASNGVDIGAFLVNGTGAGQFGISGGDNGSSNGSFLSIGRNDNASTPAGGHIRFVDRGGATYYVHADDSGVLRIGTTNPTSAADTTNGVVGQQTSALAFKNVIGAPTIEDVLTGIASGAEAVRRFTYKPIGSEDERITPAYPYGGQEFSGIVVDYAPRYGMDRSERYPHGQSLNVISAIGDLMVGTDHLHRRIRDLEAEVAELKRRLS